MLQVGIFSLDSFLLCFFLKPIHSKTRWGWFAKRKLTHAHKIKPLKLNKKVINVRNKPLQYLHSLVHPFKERQKCTICSLAIVMVVDLKTFGCWIIYYLHFWDTWKCARFKWAFHFCLNIISIDDLCA